MHFVFLLTALISTFWLDALMQFTCVALRLAACVRASPHSCSTSGISFRLFLIPSLHHHHHHQMTLNQSQRWKVPKMRLSEIFSLPGFCLQFAGETILVECERLNQVWRSRGACMRPHPTHFLRQFMREEENWAILAKIRNGFLLARSHQRGWFPIGKIWTQAGYKCVCLFVWLFGL